MRIRRATGAAVMVALVACFAAPHAVFAQGGLAPAEVSEVEGGTPDGDDEAVPPRPGIPADRLPIVVQQADEFARVFDGELRVTLALLRALRPDLPPEDRRAIRRAVRRAVRVAAMRESERQFAPAEAGGDAGDSLVAAVGEAVASTAKNLFGMDLAKRGTGERDPRADIRAALLEVVEARLGAETSRTFAAELEARDRRRRDQTVREIVAKLDDDLSLSDDQAEAIEEALREGWTEAMVLAGLYSSVQAGRAHYPGLPRRIVCGLLTESQRERFGGEEESTIERMNRQEWRRMTLFVGGRFPFPAEDPWWTE